MAKNMYGINLLNIEFIAYSQWLIGHSALLPKLSVAGKALIAENATPIERVTASRDVHNLLLTVMADAPNKIFGADEDVPAEVFTAIAEKSEQEGLNVLLLIKIVGIIMAFLRR